MGAETWRAENQISRSPANRLGRWLANLLIVVGVLLLLGAVIYAAYSLLNAWLVEQDRYLVSPDIASLSIPDRTTSLAPPAPESSGAVSPTQPSPPVQIRIPAIDVERSIIELPLTQNSRTGAWTRNLDSLFRSGRRDLVGHWGGSSYPGEEGNTILVGHNYGYGIKAVFVRLGRLRTGQEVQVVNEEGQTFTYAVKTVDRVKWHRKNLEEARQHSTFLAPGGPERLTLVTCGGASVEPFPERIYVVAEPVR